jgi:hypothetical protein
MTATIAAFGLVPLLFATGPGSEIQKPLAIVVIGGLISSTLLTLVLLPILYERFGNRGPNGRREIALSIPDPGPWKKERPMRKHALLALPALLAALPALAADRACPIPRPCGPRSTRIPACRRRTRGSMPRAPKPEHCGGARRSSISIPAT